MSEMNNDGQLDGILSTPFWYYVFDNGYVALGGPAMEKNTYEYRSLYSTQADEIYSQLNQIGTGSVRMETIPVLMEVDSNYLFWIDKQMCSNAQELITSGNVYDITFELDGASQEIIDQWASTQWSWAGVVAIIPYNENAAIID